MSRVWDLCAASCGIPSFLRSSLCTDVHALCIHSVLQERAIDVN